MNPKYLALGERIEARLEDKLVRLPTRTGELGFNVGPDALLECCRVLRDDPAFKFEILIDVCGVDYLTYGQDEWQTQSATETGFSRGVTSAADPASALVPVEGVAYAPPSRFAVVYHFLSITHNHRLRLKAFCADDARPIMPSVCSIWHSADWYEREAFDLYGILFPGHPDLRRLLTDYGFIGHPFRKDFPLIGNVEMRYDPEKGRVIYEPVSIEPRTLVPKVIREDNRYDPELKGGGDA
jgi:NADH-quinone oxidoreductase subunit C